MTELPKVQSIPNLGDHTGSANDAMSRSPSPIEFEFDDSQCLFCSQTSEDIDHNLTHMSKSHGLHIDPSKLLVDIPSFLGYLHLIIFECYECLYCGVQRNTLQAVQQHMIAKGHCKYDLEDRKSELRDFYDLTLDVHEASQDPSARITDHSHIPLQARLRQARRGPRLVQPPDRDHNRAIFTNASHSEATDNLDTSPGAGTATSPSRELSARVLKQEHTLNKQLSQLRANDQRSLAHLPSSQQRAILATTHHQMQQARKTEQSQRGRLEGSANHTARLSTIRLIRKPPHTGNIHSLNR